MFAWREGKFEEAGIPASAIEEMEKLFAEEQVNIHGYMLVSGQNILSEKYYKRYSREKMHRVYSVTKSFVTMAVGILLQKGMIRLEDKICDYFPEYLPEGGAYEWCAEMTIEDMLMMRTCFAKTTYKAYDNCSNWTESFFKTKPDHICGTVFNYDTSAAHVLGALAEKLTGMDLMDFLRKEAFQYVGFSEEAYIIKDPVGTSQGGSGAMCTLRDMAGTAYLANHFGNVEGRQLIPEDFMRMAVSNLTPTDLQPVLDEQAGYGYFIWMPRVRDNINDGFVMYGMGGQLAVCFPEYDFCFLTIADTMGNGAGLQVLYDCFYHTIFPYLERQHGKKDTNAADQINTTYNLNGAQEENQIGNQKKNQIGNQIKNIELTGSTGCAEKDRDKMPTDIYYIDGNKERKIIYSPTNASDPVQNYTFYENSHGWRSIQFDFRKRLVVLEYTDSDQQEKTLTLVYDTENGNLCAPFSDNGYECLVRGYTKMGHLFVFCHMVDEENGHVGMEFAWKDAGRLSVRMTATSEPFYDRLKGFGAAYRG